MNAQKEGRCIEMKKRDLQDEYLYVWLDGIYTKIRENDRFEKTTKKASYQSNNKGYTESGNRFFTMQSLVALNNRQTKRTLMTQQQVKLPALC